MPLELGAQWIGDTHHRMEALAAELGVGIYRQFEDGETSYEFAGEVLREQAFRARYADELSGVERVLRKLDQMAETVPVGTPRETALSLTHLSSRSTTPWTVSPSPAGVAWSPPDARSSWPCRPRWRDGSCTTRRCPECVTS